MLRNFIFYSSRPREHEIAVLREPYKQLDLEDVFDIDSKIKNVRVVWKAKNAYRLVVNYRTWAIPRLWDAPRYEGLNDHGKPVMTVKFEMNYGIPLCLDIRSADAISIDRHVSLPAQWRLVDGHDFAVRPPLCDDFIGKYEVKADALLPSELVEFLTSERSQPLRHAICPLIESHRYMLNGDPFYMIFNGGLWADFLIQLNPPTQKRAPFAHVYLADGHRKALCPYAGCIDQLLDQFMPFYGNFLYF